MDTVDSALTTTDLLTLVETGRELAAEISLRALLHNILSKATQLTSSSASSIILFDERRQVLYFAAATGPKAAMVLKRWGKLSEKGIPLTGSKAGEVFATGQSMIIDAVEADVNHY